MAHRKALPGTHRIRDHKGTYRLIETDHLLSTARQVAIEQLAQGPALTSPQDTQRYLENALGSLKHECFVVVLLDTRHQVLGYEELFNGTIDGATVYPRVVAEKALACGAAALIVAHNHPSGNSEPSLADQAITRRLKEALALLDIRLLDHFVIGKTCVSFAERGLL